MDDEEDDIDSDGKKPNKPRKKVLSFTNKYDLRERSSRARFSEVLRAEREDEEEFEEGLAAEIEAHNQA
jgi:hypothetical protein